MPRMRIGVLTGGGDCPGLNAVIRGVVRAGVNRHGHEIVGFRYGWAGVLERNIIGLTPQSTAGILHRGGTILGTSRTNPYKGDADGTALVRATLEAEGIDALIRGFQLTTPDDHEKLRLTAPLYDALYAYCQQKVARQPARDGRPRPRLRYLERVEAHLAEDGAPAPAGKRPRAR